MTVRVRLTALYAALFAGLGAGLLGASYWLLDAHLSRTLSDLVAAQALADLAAQYALALAGGTLVAVALGWAVADRVLAPLKTITETARRVSRDRLDERIALDGPPDELRELGETMDGMLERLGGAFAAQERFVANASHELRSPLTEIRTEAEVALADPDASVEDLRAMGEAVVDATERIDDLLESLMLLARSQAGQLGARPADLGSLTGSALAAARADAAERGLAPRAALGPAPVVGDPALLGSLAGNLVENAVRYADPDGDLALATWLEGGFARLRVENSGRVLGTAEAARLVEPFERGGRHGDDGGAGLGLSIVRAATEAHGGELRLVPREGGGLVAEVAIPAGPGAPGPAGLVPSYGRARVTA